MPTIAQPCSGPVSKRHERATLDQLVDFRRPDLWAVLTEEQRQAIVELCPSGKGNMWGNRRGINDCNIKRAHVDKVYRGMDVVLVSNQVIYRRGTVLYAFHNSELARRVYGEDAKSGQTWEFLYIVGNLQGTNEPFGKTLQGVSWIP